jgi:ubiquinone/menaquinone biosynthesis C-methylase UbiE
MTKFFLPAIILFSYTCTIQEKPVENYDEPGIREDYLNTNRGIWQKPDLIMELLGDLEGKTVADIGAGSGFFTMKMLPYAEKVIAIDIDPAFISILDSLKKETLPESQQWRMETRLAVPEKAPLNAQEVDVVLIVNTFMYIQDRVQYLKNLKANLKPGGKIVIIDFKKKITSVGPPKEIRLPLHLLEDELYEAGFDFIQTNDTYLDYQYIIIAGIN